MAIPEALNYKKSIKLFESRSQMRNMKLTTAKISKYHILERENTGRDICHKVINTNIGLSARYNKIRFDSIIPTLSPILELFKKRHNRCNYIDKLQWMTEKDSKRKKKFKNSIHVLSMQSFFGSLLYKIVPLELFGTLKNVKVIKKIIYHLLRTVPKKMLLADQYTRGSNNLQLRKKTRKYAVGASFHMQLLLKKFDISKVKWLQPIKFNIEQWIIILKLLHWFFAQYIIKILHKYIVLISARKCWVYIRKDHWCQMQKEFIKEKESTGGLVIVNKINKENELKWWNPTIGTYKFIPSRSGLRPLFLSKYKEQYQYDAIDLVMRFLQQLYITYFNKKGIPKMRSCKQEIYRFRQSAKKQLYFVRCDVQDAFGSIIQEKLFDIIKPYSEGLPDILSPQNYILQKSQYNKNKNKNQITGISKEKTFQFENLEKSIGKKGSIDETRKVKNITKKKVFSHIQRLIFAQKVKIDHKIYAITTGLPQGARQSPILAQIYYQHMINKVFSKYMNNGLITIYVDDILYITEDKDYASEFLEIIMNGIPDYNVKFNPDKIQSNVHPTQKVHKIKFLDFEILF